MKLTITESLLVTFTGTVFLTLLGEWIVKMDTLTRLTYMGFCIIIILTVFLQNLIRTRRKLSNRLSILDIAIKQLQDPSLTTRLAGIDGLNRIALNSPKNYFYTVIDILTAFVKEKSPLPQTGDTPDNQDGAVLNNVKDLPLDIQKAVQVIGDFKKPRRKNKKHTIDLSGTDLRNISLINADLRWIDFEWTILRGAKLNGAKLKGANFDNVDIRWADLTDTDLHKTNMLDTKYNENTVFPKGFSPKGHNMLFLSMDNDP